MKFIHSKCRDQALFRIFVFVACIVVTVTSVAQNQYYVATTGSDSNDGSQARPWATINHAGTALIVGGAGTCTATSGWTSSTGVGACVHVAPGTYSGTITTDKSGSASARIRYITDTQYGARLVGTSGGGVFWSAFDSYIDIVGFDFDGSVNAAMRNGIIVYIPNGHNLVSGNKIHDTDGACNVVNAGTALAEGFTGTPPTQPSANIWDSNLVYHINCGADGTTNQASQASGIIPGWGDIVRNNIFMDIGGGWCIEVSHTANAVIVTNNTVLNCARGGILIANPTGQYQGGTQDFTTVTNNIVVNSGRFTNDAGIRLYGGSATCGSKNIYANNLLYGNAGGNYDFGACTNTSTGTQNGSNSTTFVNYTGTISGDYHLKAGSTAINNGTTVCAAGLGKCVAPVDFEGIARSLTSGFAIGPYESAGRGVGGVLTAPSGLTAAVQ